MKKCLLLLICSLLCIHHTRTDKAEELLKTLDLEEIVEKLEEYDVDQDGQLSELEVELQQPGIQKYLDRYAELLKAEEEEEEEKEEEENTDKEETKNAQKTAEVPEAHAQNTRSPASKEGQQEGGSHTGTEQAGHKDTATPSSLPQQEQDSRSNAAVEDEDDGVVIEVIEDLQFVEDDDTWSYSHMFPVIAAVVIVGVLTVLYVVCTNPAQQVKRQQNKGQSKLSRM